MKKFRDAKLQILVATDLAARGLDVEGITHVFNYDIPEDTDSYIHRIGRTGRAGETGLAITLATPRDKIALQSIEKGIGKSVAKDGKRNNGENTSSDKNTLNRHKKSDRTPGQKNKESNQRNSEQRFSSKDRDKRVSSNRNDNNKTSRNSGKSLSGNPNRNAGKKSTNSNGSRKGSRKRV